MDGAPEWNGLLLASATQREEFAGRTLRAGEIDHIKRDQTIVPVKEPRPARYAGGAESYMMTATRNSDAEECYLIRRGR